MNSTHTQARSTWWRRLPATQRTRWQFTVFTVFQTFTLWFSCRTLIYNCNRIIAVLDLSNGSPVCVYTQDLPSKNRRLWEKFDFNKQINVTSLVFIQQQSSGLTLASLWGAACQQLRPLEQTCVFTQTLSEKPNQSPDLLSSHLI